MVTYPKEWQEYTIGDITRTVVTGGTPSTARQEYYGGNIPWLSSTEIHQKRIKKPTTYITDLGLQYSSAKIAPERSVLIALAGQGKTRGTAAYLTRPMALNQSLAALVTNEKSNPDYLYYLIESMYLPLRELSSGDGGRGGLNKKLIKGVTVTIPMDVAEQEDIAEALSTFDTYIADLTELIEKKRGLRDGALEDMMSGRTRLRGFTMDWVVYPFSKYFSLLPTNTCSREQLSDRGQIGDIHYGDVLIKYGNVLSDADEIPRLKDTSRIKERSYLQMHDVLIADTAEDETVGKVVQVGKVSIPLVGGLHTIACRPNYETAEGFLGYYMNSSQYHEQLYPYITGIKVSSVSKKSFGETELCIPAEVEAQKAIVSVLKAMDDEIEALETERDKMIQIREGAMDDLLTGRVRLRV